MTELKRLKELESENSKLKHMYADMALKDLIEKSSLIAQLGIYIHEGHGQFVKSPGELPGMF